MHNTLLKKLKVAFSAIVMASAANQAAAQVNSKTAICEVRPGCQVKQGYTPSGFNEPFCEEIFRNTQFIGGQCQGGMLSGVVQEVIWVDGRPYYKFFRIYENGVNSQPNGDYFVKHERGRLVIERIGFGTVHDCGTIGAFSPWPGSESECQKARQAYGEGAFSKQPPLKRDRFKVKTVSVIQGDVSNAQSSQANDIAARPAHSAAKTEGQSITAANNPRGMTDCKMAGLASPEYRECMGNPAYRSVLERCQRAIYSRDLEGHGGSDGTKPQLLVSYKLNLQRTQWRREALEGPECSDINRHYRNSMLVNINKDIQQWVTTIQRLEHDLQATGSGQDDCRKNNPYIPKNTCQ